MKVCGYDQVLPNDDFFELGGTSLQAAEVVAALHGIVGENVSLMVAFFEEPTVAATARAIEEGLDADELAALVSKLAS